MTNALTEAMNAAREAVFTEHFDAVAASEALYRVLAVIEAAAQETFNVPEPPASESEA